MSKPSKTCYKYRINNKFPELPARALSSSTNPSDTCICISLAAAINTQKISVYGLQLDRHMWNESSWCSERLLNSRRRRGTERRLRFTACSPVWHLLRDTLYPLRWARPVFTQTRDRRDEAAMSREQHAAGRPRPPPPSHGLVLSLSASGVAQHKHW